MKMINWGRDGASLSVSDPCDERCLDRGLKPEEGRGLLLLSDCLSSTPSTQAPASYDPRVENKQWTLGSWDWMEGKFPLATERPLKSLAYVFLLFLWPVELWLLTRWQSNSISCSEKCSLAKKGFVPDGGRLSLGSLRNRNMVEWQIMIATTQEWGIGDHGPVSLIMCKT